MISDEKKSNWSLNRNEADRFASAVFGFSFPFRCRIPTVSANFFGKIMSFPFKIAHLFAEQRVDAVAALAVVDFGGRGGVGVAGVERVGVGGGVGRRQRHHGRRRVVRRRQRRRRHDGLGLLQRHVPRRSDAGARRRRGRRRCCARRRRRRRRVVQPNLSVQNIVVA